jgi:hypothetical protein
VKTLCIAVVLTAALVLSGCEDKSSSETSGPDSGSEQTVRPGVTQPPVEGFLFDGTVAYKDLEGGFFAIDADDGRHFEPANLPEGFRQDGLRVHVRARTLDIVTIYQYGQPIEILEIARRP